LFVIFHACQIFELYLTYIYNNYRCSFLFFFFSSRRRHTRSKRDWSSDVCSSDLITWGEAVVLLWIEFECFTPRDGGFKACLASCRDSTYSGEIAGDIGPTLLETAIRVIPYRALALLKDRNIQAAFADFLIRPKSILQGDLIDIAQSRTMLVDVPRCLLEAVCTAVGEAFFLQLNWLPVSIFIDGPLEIVVTNNDGV